MPTKAPLLSKAPVSVWQGFYVGAHGGYASGDVDINIAGNPGSGSPKGGFGGFQVGYNYLVTPNWLVGYEVDASFGDIEDSTSPVPASSFNVNKFGTARGRLGYVSGPWLLYGTFGTAFAKPELTAINGAYKNDRPLIGWAGGGGVEYAFLPNWSAKVEYIYADFGEAHRNFSGNQFNTELTMSMVRAGLNYHFGNAGGARASAAPVYAQADESAAWNGPYIGVHGGYARGHLESRFFVGSETFDPDGGYGGIQGGYNWQFAPHWVIGLEADSSWGSIKEKSGDDHVTIDAMGTVRGRLGYAANNMLFYGTGGLAWAHLDSTTQQDQIFSDYYRLGWTAGAGIEYQFAPRWSAKVEYAYMDFGSNDETAGAVHAADRLDVQTIKLGLNYQASLFNLFTR